MKKWKIITVILVFATVLVGPIAYQKYDWIRKYGEAEPIVQIVWPLSQSMKKYYETTGQNATSLAQLSSDSDVLKLSRFNPEFSPNESQIFTVMINDKFGFFISDEYNPQWIFPK
jgi:hypothetical protein